ncbi:MAG: hypothetical protein MOGMAGMI_00643 [Candidatus Omnitrophica bacterium]|nr:hypothetical protein [Candidatus Omnitrophota bacterium]
MQSAWQKAVDTTRLLRPRIQPLRTFESTKVPYIFLAPSSVNRGDTVVRKGEVVVEKPSIVLPMGLPQFEGFELEEGMALNEDLFKSFLLVRGVKLPSMKYHNTTGTLEVRDGSLDSAIAHYRNHLGRSEDTHTGLLAGEEDVWPLAVLILVCQQVARSAPGDLKNLLEEPPLPGLS